MITRINVLTTTSISIDIWGMSERSEIIAGPWVRILSTSTANIEKEKAEVKIINAITTDA